MEARPWGIMLAIAGTGPAIAAQGRRTPARQAALLRQLLPGEEPVYLFAERLIELSGAILAELDNWRRQYPQDSAVGAFALMAKHLRELQGYFRKKQHEMAKPCATVEVAATGTTGQ
jgi:hypothetical protein